MTTTKTTKTLIISSTQTSIILLLTILLSLTVTATGTDSTVLDTENNPLKPNTPYYILPSNPNQGGGLTTDNIICPQFASQDPLQTSLGKPLIFTLNPTIPTQTHITLKTDLNFIFSTFVTGCDHDVGWKITLDDLTGRRFVGLGVVSGAFGPKSVGNWFKIEKAENGLKGGYKIVYCPSVCKDCKVLCGSVSVFSDENGTRFLGFRGKPLLVKFMKA